MSPVGLALLDEILQSLESAHFDDLARGLGLEHLLLLGERIDSFVGLGGRFLDDDDLQQAGDGENAGSLFADGVGDLLGQGIKNRCHLFARQLGWLPLC